MKLFLFFVGISFFGFGQTKFDPEKLQQPQNFGFEIASELNTIEVFEYKDTMKNCLFLKNGFRSSKFVNEKIWLDIRDTVEVTRIDIVYSKYPLRKGKYEEIYPLLFGRLNALFELDAALNSKSITWNKVLQTNCINDKQVNTLYHGIVIYYKTKSEIDAAELLEAENHSKIDKLRVEKEHLVSEQNSIEELKANIDFMVNSPFMPDSIKKILRDKPLDEQVDILSEYFKKNNSSTKNIDLKNVPEEEFKMYQEEVNWFGSNFTSYDPVVTKVFDRHPEWKNILVVNDWTGSMYGYGAQVLQWHMLNIEKSEIISVTLFNDGDFKGSQDKIIGETDGIYSELADNIPEMIDLFNYVMLQGSGGDGPENDVEAILNATSDFDDFSEIVLIADNNACVRDIELADRIGKPVRIILCGYDPKKGINPDFVFLAKITGGGIYTIDEDLENLKVEIELGNKGEVKSVIDARFTILKNMCGDLDELLKIQELYTFEYAKRHKKKVRKLSLSDSDLAKIPKAVFKMKKLSYLDLSHNQLKELSPKIADLHFLKTLNASFNELSTLPFEFKYIKYLTELNLSNNQFKEIPESMLKLTVLTSLDLSFNQLSDFKDINYPKLINLNLSNNEFSEIPKDLLKLKTLRNLDLSNNQIGLIPDKTVSLRRLYTLNLSNNNLTKLPSDISKLFRLITLNLEGNNFSVEEIERIKKALPRTKIIY